MLHVAVANESFLDILSQLEPVASVIKLLSNPRIPNNALAYGSGHYYGILGLLNLAEGSNYYIIYTWYQRTSKDY